MADVVTHSRFRLNEIDTETLKGMGVEVLTDFPSDADLGLADPKYGEEVLGTLTSEEFSIFVEFIEVSREIETMQKGITSRKLREVADRIQEDGDLTAAAFSAVSEVTKNLFDKDEDEQHYFWLSAKAALLKSTFYWVLGEKFECHQWRCGVRSKRRFVRIERRTANG